jgi:hypothetical protein
MQQMIFSLVAHSGIALTFWGLGTSRSAAAEDPGVPNFRIE